MIDEKAIESEKILVIKDIWMKKLYIIRYRCKILEVEILMAMKKQNYFWLVFSNHLNIELQI